MPDTESSDSETPSAAPNPENEPLLDGQEIVKGGQPDSTRGEGE